MKDFLENLEIGEGKIKLSKEEIKSILAEHGKSITTETEKVKADFQKENNDLKSTISDLKTQIENAPNSNEMENLKSKIAEYEKKESERIALDEKAKQDAIINKNILEVIGDKQFVNDRTKNAIINEIKTALEDKANVGKSAKDIFESITKDSSDIFKPTNELKNDMPSMSETEAIPTKSEGLKLNPMFRQY